MNKKKILITGAAGFISFHLIKSLLKSGKYVIIGIDNINEYYDVNLKKARLKELVRLSGSKKEICDFNQFEIDNFKFYKIDLIDTLSLNKIFEINKFDYVINLAAQAGVRYSITNPKEYIQSNIIGFYNLLECARKFKIDKVLYASSSSVYGLQDLNVGFTEDIKTDSPISLYAASKKSNEIIAHSYSHLYNIKTIGLRFFTVYGSWGRPDMAYYSFTEKISKGENLNIYNFGVQKRDFTHITDVVKSIILLLDRLEAIKSNYEILNIGNNKPVALIDFVSIIENLVDKNAKLTLVEAQPGDVEVTFADCNKLQSIIGYKPETNLKDGLNEFIQWYKIYHGNQL